MYNVHLYPYYFDTRQKILVYWETVVEVRRNKHFFLLKPNKNHNLLFFLYFQVENKTNKPQFIPVASLEDAQAIRTVTFHPAGNLFAVGSNSKVLRICEFPNISDLRLDLDYDIILGLSPLTQLLLKAKYGHCLLNG